MYFQYWQSANDNQWYWRLNAANHETIARSSEGYSSSQNCLHSIDLVKQAYNAPVQKV